MPDMEIKLATDLPGHGKAGDTVQLALKPSDVHDPTELPSYLAGYSPFQYRADEMSPVVLVDNDEDKFRNFSEDDAFRRVEVKGSTQGAVPEVDPKTTLNTYKVIERYVGAFIPKQTMLQSGGSYSGDKVRMAAGRRCRRALALDRELDVMALLGTAANFNANNRLALGAGENWNGGGSSDPVEDIQTIDEASAAQITGWWGNKRTMNAFLRHPSVRDHMRQFLGDQAIQGMITQMNRVGTEANPNVVDFAIPGLGMFHVAGSKVKNESTGNLDFVLGDSLIAVTTPPGVPEDGEEIATSYTFRRRGESGVGFESREFELENRGPLGGTMIVVSQADIAIMTGPNVGGIITGIIA
jgi:hypothetical protein